MWYQKHIDSVCADLDTSRDGLRMADAQKRLKQHGPNELPQGKQDGLIKIFLMQFVSPIIAILIVAIVLALIVGEYIDAIFIFAVILINGILGTVQEYAAEKSAEKLQDMIRVDATVIRDGKKIVIDSKELVVGDVVLLNSGDKVPADIRLFDVESLMVDESILTGESEGIEKDNGVIETEVAVPERKNMVYAGTIVLSGRGKGIVVETASKTEIGRIADKVMTVEDAASPLVIRVKKFSKQLSITFAIMALVLSLILYYKGYMIREIFFSVVALTVSAIPEGLSTAMTIALSISSHRMAKKNVIVKKLSSVESLGSCSVIASDKTGTLTVNEQTAKVVMMPWGDSYYIKGAGYDVSVKTDFGDSLGRINKKQMDLIAKLGMLNNEAELKYEDKKWSGVGDSIDVAFLVLGEKLGLNVKDTKMIARIPYESQKKYSAVYFKNKEDKENYFTIKGSVEKVLEFCDKMATKDGNKTIDKKMIKKQSNELAGEGYRVIALAYGKKKELDKKASYSDEDLPKMTFVGMVGFVDPIRDDVVDAVKFCDEAGVKVYMITGDHPLTAYYIGERIGIVSDYDGVATSEDIDTYLKLGKEKFDEYLKGIRVCARVTPTQKLEIVESLKRQGEFVAVTGDGVNDAPALKSANIGIAMGSGSDVAKETGDMIIADDNFSTIVTGIKEGRKAYNNIRNVIYLLLSTGLSEIILFVLSIICDMPMPLTAVQFLWLNLITNGIQDNALAFEKNGSGIMKDKVRSTKEGVFDKLLISEILLSAAVIALIVFELYNYLYNVRGMDITTVRTYIMVVMVFMENMHIFNCRSEKISMFRLKIRDNYFVISTLVITSILQVIIVRTPGFANVFGLDTIPFENAIVLLLLTAPVLVIMELFKFFVRAQNKKAP